MISDKFQISSEEAKSGKGRIKFKHGNTASESGAFEKDKRKNIILSIPKSLMSNSVYLRIFNEDNTVLIKEIDMKFKDVCGSSEIYETRVNDLSELEVGLYYIELVALSLEYTFYGFMRCGEIYFKTERSKPNIQILISDFKYKESDIFGGIIYHVFVDRFARSSSDPKIRNDARYIPDWNAEIPEFQKYPGEPIKNDYFYGGDLYGIVKKLGHLESLGVTTIYLSPIFESPSNHKYDTADYMSVDEGFGGDKALRCLITKAKEKNIGIILDGVFNHTGSDSIYFNKNGRYAAVGAYQSKDSVYYPWYKFYKYPSEYETWWGIQILPKIDTNNPCCREFFVGENGVISKYRDMGIAGFRLDVVDELSDSFVRDIKSRLSENNNASMLYGEVWEDASNKIAYGKRKRYYLGEELDGVMNYPLREGIIEYIKYKKIEKLLYALTEVIQNAPKRIRDAQMNILGTHDTERILTALGRQNEKSHSNEELSMLRLSESELKASIKKLKGAYTVIATLPGIPCIYYGDEAGLEGYNDPFNRRTYPWQNENKELLEHYKRIGSIRRKNSIYKKGEFRLLYLTIDILLFVRYNKGKSAYFTLLNNSKEDITVSFSSVAYSLIDSIYTSSARVAPETAAIFKSDKYTTVYLSK